MVALDSSAIVAILLSEAEEYDFRKIIGSSGAEIGAPTLVEVRLVLAGKTISHADAALRQFLARESITVVPFDAVMFEAAIEAFARFGKGGGHPAQLNFGDCLSYAVAKTRALPLLFKGNDFVHTDLVPAYAAAP